MKTEKFVQHEQEKQSRQVRTYRQRRFTYVEIEELMSLKPARGWTAWRSERRMFKRVPKPILQKYA